MITFFKANLYQRQRLRERLFSWQFLDNGARWCRCCCRNRRRATLSAQRCNVEDELSWAVGDWKWGMTKPSGIRGCRGREQRSWKGRRTTVRMPRTLLLLFRGRSNGYQIFAAPLANNASLDKPESLFTIAGYSFVVFFLGGSNVDSSCCRFNLQFSEATFVALRFPFFLSDEFARACELLFSVAGTCYDYVQTSFLTAIACYRKIKLPEQGVIGLCLWSAIYFVYDQHFIVSQTSYAKQHSLCSFQTFYSLSETNQPFLSDDFYSSSAGDSRSHSDMEFMEDSKFGASARERR